LGDKEFAREILEKAEATAEGTPQLVEATQRVLHTLDDKALAQRLLQNAEESVTSLGELRSVAEVIKTRFADQADWVARIEEKLARREANQAKYTSFQERENKTTSLLGLLKLADSVMSELEDPFYARKLLVAAENTLSDQSSDFTQNRALILAIDKHLGDEDWLKRLLDGAAANCTQFAALRAVGESASRELKNDSLGIALAKRYYGEWEDKLEATDTKTAYDYTKLADAVSEDLGDSQWALGLVEKAAEIGGDHFSLARMGKLALQLGDNTRATTLFQRAAAACRNVEQVAQLSAHLKRTGINQNIIHNLYASAKSNLNSPSQLLDWVEGIVKLFGDRQWAAQEYADLSDSMTLETDKARYQSSRKLHLEQRL
jgi:hypothetical protein